MNKVRVFVSYSWDSDDHRLWVKKLADSLESYNELHVEWDGYDLDSMSDKNLFMEKGISSSDYILVVATEEYKRKADERKGGVGIETYLSTAKHWDSLLAEQRTNVILLLKDRNAIPNYLKGNKYIQFYEDSNFESSLIEVINQVSSGGCFSRPPKLNSINKIETSYSFTRTEDVIKVNNKKRRCLVSAKDGTDYSGSNRIKYELWEAFSPSSTYFLALPENVNLAQTAKRAAIKIKEIGCFPLAVIVLRPRPGRPEQALIETAFQDVGLKVHIYEYTYKDYVWEYCIEDGLKLIDPPSVVEYYTDQPLVSDLGNEDPNVAQSAVDFLVEELKLNSSSAAHLVVASGGMGKTSLCNAVASHLYNKNELKLTVVTIHSEVVKKYVNENGTGSIKIDSIFDLYEIYSKQAEHDQVFDRSSFDLAVLCGNLIVLIDGLDELVSVFQGKFDLDMFFQSIANLHNELGSSKILITTRSTSVLTEKNLANLNIKDYGLLGFDQGACTKYLKKRFRGLVDSDKLVAKVSSQVAKVNLDDSENRIVPFFVDIAATVVEDQLKESGREDFNVIHTATPYPSNEELVDHVIHSVFRREETRHGFSIRPLEAVQFISGLVADYGGRWPRNEVFERLNMFYDNRAEELIQKISINPLFVNNGDYIELKYGFLVSYFEVLFVIDGIITKSKAKEFLRSLAKLGAETQEFKDIKRFFVKNLEVFEKSLVNFIPELREMALVIGSGGAGAHEREWAKNSIAVLIGLLVSVKHLSGDKLMDSIFHVYGVDCSKQSKERKLLRGLYISGDFPPLNFDGLTVSESRFKGYKNFLNSKFGDTSFIYTVFDGCGNVNIKSTLFNEPMVDETCEIGDLSYIFGLLTENSAREEKMIEDEARRFLGSFFRGDRFRDNNRIHIRTSNKVSGLSFERMNSIISAGYIRVSAEKNVDTFYEVAGHFQPSVRRFLDNNYLDSFMNEFLSLVKQQRG